MSNTTFDISNLNDATKAILIDKTPLTFGVVNSPLVQPKAVRPVVPTTKIISSNNTANGLTVKEDIARFYIEYKNLEGVKQTFSFALLPAIESNLQLATSGLVRGNGANVPKVRPGISVNTIMRHKNIPIPGGVPVVQTIGIDSTKLMLVGSFIGSEVNGADYAKPSLDPIDYGVSDKPILENDLYSANQIAEFFRTEVINQGAKVRIVIESSNADSSNNSLERFDYTGVITMYDFFGVRRARAYWSIDMLVTDYKINKKVAALATVTVPPAASVVAAPPADRAVVLQRRGLDVNGQPLITYTSDEEKIIKAVQGNPNLYYVNGKPKDSIALNKIAFDLNIDINTVDKDKIIKKLSK